MKRQLSDWLNKRLPIQPIIGFFAKKNVPDHRYSIWYSFGGMAFTLLAIQMITGVMLLFYYKSDPSNAHESIVTITRDVPFGWLIRSIHAYGANLLILIIFIHMFSVMLLKGYRKPRELTWVTGFALLCIFLTFGFSGYLLPWNELSFAATNVGTEIAASIPVFGHTITEIMRGGAAVNDITLARFFALHVGVLPYLALIIVGLHLAFIQAQGVSSPRIIEEEAVREKRKIPAIRFFPDYMLHDAINALLLLLLLVFLAVVAQATTGPKANPIAATPEGTEPEWYFLFMYQTLRLLPAHVISERIQGKDIGVLCFIFGGIYLFILPFIDRKRSDGKHHPFFTLAGVFIIAYVIVLTLVAWINDLYKYFTGG